MKRVESRVSVENVFKVDGAAALTSILVDHRHHLEQEGGGEEKERPLRQKFMILLPTARQQANEI